MDMQKKCVEVYRDCRHLKIAGERLGIPWQTVYVYLRKANEPVIGDKSRYGSEKDKFGALAESMFAKAVPDAVDNNQGKYQATIDFTVHGHTVDVKSSRLHPARVSDSGKRYVAKWGFCVNKQKDVADFFVLYAFDQKGEELVAVFLVPREMAVKRTTISIAGSRNGVWWNYEVSESELSEFFDFLGSMGCN